MFGIISVLFTLISLIGAQDSESQLFKQLPARIITKDNFNAVINEPLHGTFILFQAPWCGHCKRAIPIWSELATAHNSEHKFVIGKVDCTVDTELCSNEDVLGYPSFIFYKKGETIGYRFSGELTFQELEAFMFEQIYEKLQTEKEERQAIVGNVKNTVNVLSTQNFHAAISEGFHFVKFFAPWCGHCKQMEQVWKDLAGQVKNVFISEVDCTIEFQICQEKGIRGYPTLIFFQNGKQIDSYKENRALESFLAYLNKMVAKLEDENQKEEPKDLVDKLPEEKPNEDKPLELKESENVLELTSSNIESSFAMPGLLFVKFFAPWCSHCKTMATTWTELANIYNRYNNIVIAEVDCTKFGIICQKHEIRGYPSLIMFENGEQVEKYSGQRDLENFSNFIKKYLTKYHDEL